MSSVLDWIVNIPLTDESNDNTTDWGSYDKIKIVKKKRLQKR